MQTLEFYTIRKQLADLAMSDQAKEQLLALSPILHEGAARRAMAETTEARTILTQFGMPPLSQMQGVAELMRLCGQGGMLLPEQLTALSQFLRSCTRTKAFFRRAQSTRTEVSLYAEGLYDVEELVAAIDNAIRDGRVDDHASPRLKDLRRKMEQGASAVRTKLDNLLRANPAWFSDSLVVIRAGRQALPVKKEHRSRVPGVVLDVSGSGGTVFIEPAQAKALVDALALLEVEAENEERKILYQLTGDVAAYEREIIRNMECMQVLDALFAKAQLSVRMDGREVALTRGRELVIVQGRHPLIEKDRCVPLDFCLGDTPGGPVQGVVITGPNTGGKTVALKTIGLFTLMAACGLHLPCGPGTRLPLASSVLCDIGDGQSITENLSTFSAHITHILSILKTAAVDSLVLLDELGSGTDPQEGMGIAVAVLEELRAMGCLFVATSHYPEIKAYAARTPGLCNARMAFDAQTLSPLYTLLMGQAGESCALLIAQRLGLPAHMIARARQAAYGVPSESEVAVSQTAAQKSQIQKETAPKEQPLKSQMFGLGDSVRVFPSGQTGVVFAPVNDKGEIGVRVQGENWTVPYKRLKLLAKAEQLYPEGYDLSIVLDTVANRKARHAIDRKGDRDAVIVYQETQR